MSRVNAGNIIKYALLPGIVPRIRSLFFGGFFRIAFYVALIYRSVRLLPMGHRFLNPDMIGTFGVMQVVREAALSLEHRWDKIDQVLIFYTILMGIILSFLYVAMAIAFIFVGPAVAQVALSDLFSIPDPTHDVAFMMMDRTFGIPDFFNTKVSQDMVLPTPFHQGMHALFAFYSYGMMMVAVIILLFYVVEILVETSVTGKPFGKHFENVFVPLRIVIAIGMLIPLAYGFNSLQWITLTVAKFGSNLATNAWAIYNKDLSNPMGLSNAELIARPVPPDATGLFKDLFVVRSCIDLENSLIKLRRQDQQESRARASSAPATAIETPAAEDGVDVVVVRASRDRSTSTVQPYIITENGEALSLHDFDGSGLGRLRYPDAYDSFFRLFEEALRLSDGKNIELVIGRYKESYKVNNTYPAGIEPTCGRITIPVLKRVDTKDFPIANPNTEILAEVPTYDHIHEKTLVAEGYFYIVMRILNGLGRMIPNGNGAYMPDPESANLDNILLLASQRNLIVGTNLRETINGYKGLPADTKCPFDQFPKDGYDDDPSGNDENITELGKCDEPVPNNFWVKQLLEQQKSIFYASVVGYEYLMDPDNDSTQPKGATQRLLESEFNRRKKAYDDCVAAPHSVATCELRTGIRAGDTAQTSRFVKDYSEKFISFEGGVSYEGFDHTNPLAMLDSQKMDMIRYGWGGAGFWYKVVADHNGSLIEAVGSLPTVTKFPLILEEIQSEKMLQDGAVGGQGCDRFKPQLASGAAIDIGGANERDLANIYYNICNNFATNETLRSPDSFVEASPNFFIKMLDMLFGAKYLFSFRDNAGVHPLAQVSALGKSLIDRVVNNMLIATGGAAVGGMASALGSVTSAIGKSEAKGDTAKELQANQAKGAATGQLIGAAGQVGKAFSGLFITFAMVTLSAGVLLHYVLPLMPFMHFFFAVGRWVKTVFEALVGMPLWALAHMKMEGAGLPSKASAQGYFMLFEILIRPIITVFSLVAAMSTFAATAYILNIVWGMMTNNLIGYDPVTQTGFSAGDVSTYRPAADQFFFMLMYVILIYMIATNCFKMIDLIPDEIMKWLSETKTFGKGDNSDEYVEQTSAWVGMPTVQFAGQVGNKAIDLVYQVPAGLGAAAGGIVDTMMDSDEKRLKELQDKEAKEKEEREKADKERAEQQQREQQERERIQREQAVAAQRQQQQPVQQTQQPATPPANPAPATTPAAPATGAPAATSAASPTVPTSPNPRDGGNNNGNNGGGTGGGGTP